MAPHPVRHRRALTGGFLAAVVLSTLPGCTTSGDLDLAGAALTAGAAAALLFGSEYADHGREGYAGPYPNSEADRAAWRSGTLR